MNHIFSLKLRAIVQVIFYLVPILFCCQSSEENEITDLIQPLLLTAGVTDSIPIGDIFFARDYPLKVQSHPDLDIEYQKDNGLLIIKPKPAAEGLTLLKFIFRDREYVIPLQITRLQEQLFRFRAPRRGKIISVFGSFNSWNRGNIPLHDSDGDGWYETIVYLEPGRYEYKFFLDGEEILDAENPEKVSNPFGSFNSVLTIQPRHSDRLFLHLLNYQYKNSSAQILFHFERIPQHTILKKDDIIALLDNSMLPKECIQIEDNKIIIDLPQSLFSQENVLRIAAAQDGMYSYFQTIRFDQGKPPEAGNGPFCWQQSIIYAIMIDRFFDGNPENTQKVDQPGLDPRTDFHGGDIEGIIQKLEEGYFQDLGVNFLWLSPVNQNTRGAFREYPPPHRYFSGYHGYWPIHHQQVDARFGDLGLFKKMVDTAHAQGIKVILDFVANHVHQEHPFFQNHPEWFGNYDLPDGRKNIRLWDEYRLTTWFDTFLPSFDYEGSREALEIMTDNAVWWIQQTGIDGFRQDAVKHVPNDFWRTLTQKLKDQIELKEQRKLFQIGETFGSYRLISSYVNNGQLNSQFNFNLYDAAIYVFLTPGASFQILDGEMHKSFSVYGVNHLMGNLMDSHDKVRYIAYADGDILLSTPDAAEVGWSNPPQVDDPLSYQKTRLYQAYLLSIPGIPVVYYGDEIGLSGASDPDNRRPMKFGTELSTNEKIMREEVRKIIHLRKDHPALLFGDFLSLQADENVYAFIRSDLNERILVILNKANKSVDLSINIPQIYQIGQAVDLRDGRTLKLDGSNLSLEMPAVDWKFFQLLP